MVTFKCNDITGSIPTELANLTGLWELFLDSNKLTGSIPSTFTNLTHLTSNWAEIDINYNGGRQ